MPTWLALLIAGVGSPVGLELIRAALAARKASRAAATKAASDATAAHYRAAVADATGRHAVQAEEVRMVPHLLERIESLEEDRDACRLENAKLEATVGDLRGEVDELKAERAQDARLIAGLRDEVASLRRITLGQ